jgi:hypothetical protein
MTAAVVSLLGPCIVCRRPFLFSPTRVPSVRVEGRREPVCRDCLDRVNRERVAQGLEAFAVAPDAYDVGDPAEEVPWDG